MSNISGALRFTSLHQAAAETCSLLFLKFALNALPDVAAIKPQHRLEHKACAVQHMDSQSWLDIQGVSSNERVFSSC